MESIDAMDAPGLCREYAGAAFGGCSGWKQAQAAERRVGRSGGRGLRGDARRARPDHGLQGFGNRIG